MTKSCNTRSNPALFPLTGDPERTLRKQKCFHTMYPREGLQQVAEAEQELIHILDQAHESLDC